MNITQEYKQKLTTPENAVKAVKSGDWVDYGFLPDGLCCAR